MKHFYVTTISFVGRPSYQQKFKIQPLTQKLKLALK